MALALAIRGLGKKILIVDDEATVGRGLLESIRERELPVIIRACDDCDYDPRAFRELRNDYTEPYRSGYKHRLKKNKRK